MGTTYTEVVVKSNYLRMFGVYTFQVLTSRLKPGCAEAAIDGGLMELLGANDK
jgi:neutral ceramidase